MNIDIETQSEPQSLDKSITQHFMSVQARFGPDECMVPLISSLACAALYRGISEERLVEMVRFAFQSHHQRNDASLIGAYHEMQIEAVRQRWQRAYSVAGHVAALHYIEGLFPKHVSIIPTESRASVVRIEREMHLPRRPFAELGPKAQDIVRGEVGRACMYLLAGREACRLAPDASVSEAEETSTGSVAQAREYLGLIYSERTEQDRELARLGTQARQFVEGPAIHLFINVFATEMFGKQFLEGAVLAEVIERTGNWVADQFRDGGLNGAA